MAASGLVLMGFVVMHLSGNLLIFLGPGPYNAYAKKLRDLGPLLWVARAFLLAAAIAHVWTSVRLARENRAARPVGYRVSRPVRTTRSARTMMASGLLLLAYVVYHLLHFTFHMTNPEFAQLVDPMGHRNVYAMVVQAFQRRGVVVIYLAAMALLCAHLSHGIASAPQTLGVANEKTLAMWGAVGRIAAFALFIGYSAIPVAVILGMVR